MLVQGFREAYDRFALARTERDATRTFFAIHEVLGWTYSIINEQHLEREVGGRWLRRHEHWAVLLGIEFARGRVHHQWADALIDMLTMASKLWFLPDNPAVDITNRNSEITTDCVPHRCLGVPHFAARWQG